MDQRSDDRAMGPDVAGESSRSMPDACWEAPAETGPLFPSIFHEPWWLEASTGGAYQVVTVEADDRVVGRLPFFVKRGLGISKVTMPPLTHFLGPGVIEGEGSRSNRLLKRTAVTRELIRQVPKVGGIYFKLHRGITEAIAFQQCGYDTLVQFTYEIRPGPEGELWRALRDKTRNVIRRAQEKLRLTDITDVQSFIDFYVNNAAARGHGRRFHSVHGQTLLQETLRRKRGRIIGAYDAGGNATAAIFYVWDSEAAYYLLTTRTGEAANGAVSMLLWEAIRDCTSRGLIFDFDGIGTPGSVLFYTGFGGTVFPRYVATRYSAIFRLLETMANRVRGTTPRLMGG